MNFYFKKNQNIGNFWKNNAWKNYPNILGKIYEYFFTVNRICCFVYLFFMKYLEIFSCIFMIQA